MKSVCVFCGSNPGQDPVYRTAAAQVGRRLAERGLRLVYGGGSVGLMGVVADAALAAGGQAVGVLPLSMSETEVAHRGLTELRIVPGMHERKALMNELSDAFLTLPGGFGTLDELFEAVTWKQLGIHGKPIGLLNVGGYFDPLIAFVDRAAGAGFVSARNRGLIRVDSDPDRLIAALAG